jgi:D-alanyl-D-alanine carboxypeptidase
VSPAGRAKAEQQVFQVLEAHASTLVKRNYQAIGIALERNGEVVASAVLGRDTRGRSLADTTRFRLASVSKMLLATAVMQLVEQGMLRLDVPFVDQWGSKPRVGDRRMRLVTVRQLLQHTSGIDSLWNTFFKDPSSDWHASVAVALSSQMHADPGADYRYSNANYVLLGSLVERVTGKKLTEVINERVLAPLGIKASSMTRTKVTDAAGPAYLVTPGRTYLEALGPAGSWTLTPSEVALLLAALRPDAEPTLLSRESRLAMQPPCVAAPHPLGMTAKERYGLGMMSHADDLWGHTGTIEGARAAAFTLPNGYVIVLLAATEAIRYGERLLHVFGDEIAALRTLPAASTNEPFCNTA